MKMYIGTKLIKAAPQECQMDDHNSRAGDPGYVVEYEDGYTSWSPKEVFDNAYRPLEGLTFGQALEAARAGHRIQRHGWNGKNMFVVFQKGYPEGIPCNAQTAEAFNITEGELFKVQPYLQMRCADGSHQSWVASQSDVLSDDWRVLTGE